MSAALTSKEWEELRRATALEVLAEVKEATPELDDVRLGYVSIQLPRALWLRARALPTLLALAMAGEGEVEGA